MTNESKIESMLKSLGFDPVGFTPAVKLLKEKEEYEEWLSKDFHGGMSYLEGHTESKFLPGKLLTGAKTVVMVALNYYQQDEDRKTKPRKGSGRVSLYAWGRDYHKVLNKKLKTALRYLQSWFPDEGFRRFVDILPLAERHYAKRAGIGFIGRNTLLITPKYGSWVFLGGFLTTLELESSRSASETVGMRCPSGCTRCIDACPTGALREPFRIDASKCISYLTIERKGRRHHDSEHQSEMKSSDWVFGCDICQLVCPFNLHHQETGEIDFKQWIAGPLIPLEEKATDDAEDFANRFSGSPLMRAGAKGLSLNLKIAKRNEYDSKSPTG